MKRKKKRIPSHPVAMDRRTLAGHSAGIPGRSFSAVRANSPPTPAVNRKNCSGRWRLRSRSRTDSPRETERTAPRMSENRKGCKLTSD
jgi:hypothetical protein